MCGIAGYYRAEGAEGPGPEELDRALARLRHRGPDATGKWFSAHGRIGLAHARLEVLDPRGGAQPMVDPETGVVVVTNGEIYNYVELLRESEARGRPTRTRSDTEALLAAFARFGDGAPRRLRGMFAFAAHDPRTGLLLLARDRLGQKPLYHASLPGGGLAFASEVGALFPLLPFSPEPDREALSIYLSFGYVPAPRTGFRGVAKLPAAHLLVAGREAPERYWSRPGPGAPPADLREAEEEIREGIREAVRLRLVADVPLGAFLSGGIDSGTVVACMAEAGSGPLRTFTVKSPQREYDESALAREVADRYGTEHTEIEIEAPRVEEIPELIARWGEPFGDSSALPTTLVSRAAREYVTVALTGDGGDEAFGGYDRFRRLDQVRRLPVLLARLARRLGGKRGRRIAELRAMEPWRRYYEFYEAFNGGLREELLDPGFRDRHGDASSRFLRDLYTGFPGSELDRMLATDSATWLADDLNPKVDIASMSVALECRSPFQDHRLVEAAARIPAGVHVRRGRTKALLRRTVRDMLPAGVMRKGKRGFAAPVEHWFRGDLRGFLESRLRGKALASLSVVRPEGVERVLHSLDHGSPTGRPRIQAWILLALALFAEGLG